MKEIDVKEFVLNPYEMIHKEWLLINSFNEEKVNSMTASWGGIGVIWNKPVMYLFVRPQRFTQELLPNNDYFSVTVLGNEYRKTLNYLGTASGRDEDKLAKAELTVERGENNIPIIKEGKLNILLKKLYVQQLTEESFIEKDLVDKHYETRDFHYMYVAEIIKVLEK